jgi:hypothetical protein
VTTDTAVTFTATVAASSGSTKPTGSVIFTIDGATAATVAVSSGTATFSTSNLAAGAHAILASYGGSSTFAASISGSLTETVNEPTAAAPAMSPAVGTYTSVQSVTLSSATPGAIIYYTTNGTPPTTSSNKYTAAIAVNSTATIEAIAVATGYNNSVTASGTYTIKLTAATPALSLPAGTYFGKQPVTISDATAGATIYYTTNGSTPTTSSARYSGALTVSGNETLQAIAVVAGQSNSAVALAAYVITAAAPTFSLAAGSYTSVQSLTITDATPGAVIYYTTSGSTPSSSAAKYNGPLAVKATETMVAVAVIPGGTNSAYTSAKFTLSLGTAATPTFSVAAGTYASPQTVTISDATPGATIYYTTNGTPPNGSSAKATGPITVSSTETIEAIAVCASYTTSALAKVAYIIQ